MTPEAKNTSGVEATAFPLPEPNSSAWLSASLGGGRGGGGSWGCLSSRGGHIEAGLPAVSGPTLSGT